MAWTITGPGINAGGSTTVVAGQWKEPVTVATTENITLSGEQTIDGTLTSEDRVLVKDETLGATNGIYVSSSGTWSRSTDFDTDEDVLNAAVWVSEGSINADQAFVCTTDEPITLGTTSLAFVKFSGLGQITAGTNLEKVENTNTLNFSPLGGVDMLNASLTNVGGFELNNTANTFQYVFTSSAITADRTVTLPLLTADDTFAFEAATQTLSNKNLTSVTGFQLNNPLSTFQYIFGPAAITADRNVALPQLTANDTFVFALATQTLSNKSLTSVEAFEFNNPLDTFQYVFSPSAITVDRTVTLPLLTADDTFVFEAATQTLSNKTLTNVAQIGINVVAPTVALDIIGEMNLVSTATTATAATITASSLTTGGGLLITSNSADVSSRSVLRVSNQNSASSFAVALQVDQVSDQVAVFINVTGNADGLQINSIATTKPLIDLAVSRTTTGNIIHVPVANYLTTGSIASFASDSFSTATRNLFEITNTNTLSTGTTVLRLEQNSTGDIINLFDGTTEVFTVLGDGKVGLNVTAPTVALDIVGETKLVSTATTASAVAITANSLTTGSGILVTSTSADTGGRSLVHISNGSSAATLATALEIEQTSPQPAVLINVHGDSSDSSGLHINSVATSAPSIKVGTTAATTGDILSIALADSLTTGSIASFASNSASTGTRNLFEITNTNALATGTTLVSLIQNSTGDILNLFDGTTEVFTVLGDGKVGLLNDTPTVEFDLTGAANISGDLTVDSGTFFVDVSADRIGIGTTAPDAELEVAGAVLAESYHSPFGGMGRLQNYVLYSEQFDNAAWSKLNGVTVTANNATAPNGETTMDTVSWASATNVSGLRQSGLGFVDSSTYTVTVWARYVSGTTATLDFSIKEGTATTITPDSTLRRYSLQVVAGVGTDQLDIHNAVSPSGSSFEIWGFQVVDGSTAFPYVKTEATALSTEVFGQSVSGTSLNETVDSGIILAEQIGINVDSPTVALDVLGETNLTSTSISASTLTITADSLSTGSAISIVSNSGDTAARSLLHINQQSSTAISAIPLRIEQNSTGSAIFVNVIAEAVGLQVSSTATTASSILLSVTSTTTGDILSIPSADSLTTGSIASFTSNSASTSTRNLFEITNTNAASAGTTLVSLTQDSTGNILSMFNGATEVVTVADDGNIGLNVTDPTVALDVVGETNLVSAGTTTSAATITASSLTTGSALSVISNSADTTGRSVLQVSNQNSASTLAVALRVDQNSPQHAIFLNVTGGGNGLQINSSSTSTSSIVMPVAATTTGRVISIPNADSLTTGAMAYFASNSTSTATRSLVDIYNNNALATGATVLSLTQVSTGLALNAVGDVAISGDLAVDTNTLFVDASTNRTGFGLTDPDATVHVLDELIVGSQESVLADRVTITSGGIEYSRGILDGTGTQPPYGRWKILSNALALLADSSTAGAYLLRDNSGAWSGIGGAIAGGGMTFHTGGTSTAVQTYDNLSATLAMVIDSSQNVAITGDITSAGNAVFTVTDEVVIITESADFTDQATANIIAVAANEDLTERFQITPTSATRFTQTGINSNLRLLEDNFDDFVVYSGTDTLFTGANAGGLNVELVGLVSAANGTLFNYTGTNRENDVSRIVLFKSILSGWQLGAIGRDSTSEFGPILDADADAFVNWTGSLTVDTMTLNVNKCLIDQPLGVSAAQPVFIVKNTAEKRSQAAFRDLVGKLYAGETLVRIDPGIPNDQTVLLTGNLIDIDDSNGLFDTSGSTGTFTAAADAPLAATSITSVVAANNEISITGVSDSGGLASFAHAGADPAVGDTVVVLGFVTNTAYNVTGTVTASSAGAFEFGSIAFGTSETVGNFSFGVAIFAFTATSTILLGEKLTLSGFATHTDYNKTGIVTTIDATLSLFRIDFIKFIGTDTATVTSENTLITSTAHGLADGDGITISTDSATDYDGGHHIFNVAANSFNINATFTETKTGTWSTEGLDQSDPRVLAFSNAGSVNSQHIACASVKNNTTANGTIVSNTFTDMAFGTLVASSTIEGFKLIDPAIGLFECTRLEPFKGSITFDFTVKSSGGTVEFRFKWQKNITTSLTATTIAFIDSDPDTITDSASGFLTAGFAAEDIIQVTGSASNNLELRIVSVTAGTITLDGTAALTTEAAGASVTIAGLFGNLPDAVEALVAVGSNAESITKTFPLATVTGDQIKPQITRNTGTSAITTTYATIYATQ